MGKRFQTQLFLQAPGQWVDETWNQLSIPPPGVCLGKDSSLGTCNISSSLPPAGDSQVTLMTFSQIVDSWSPLQNPTKTRAWTMNNSPISWGPDSAPLPVNLNYNFDTHLTPRTVQKPFPIHSDLWTLMIAGVIVFLLDLVIWSSGLFLLVARPTLLVSVSPQPSQQQTSVHSLSQHVSQGLPAGLQLGYDNSNVTIPL